MLLKPAGGASATTSMGSDERATVAAAVDRPIVAAGAGWVPTRRRPLGPLKALAAVGDIAALESARIADLENRPVWNSVLKPTKPLLPKVELSRATSVVVPPQPQESSLSARSVGVSRSGALPPLMPASSTQPKTARPSNPTALLSPVQMQKDISAFEARFNYSDDDNDDGDDPAPHAASSFGFRGAAKRTGYLHDNPPAAGNGRFDKRAMSRSGVATGTSLAASSTPLDRLADPLYGLFVGIPLSKILAAYRSIETEMIRKQGLALNDFHRFLACLLPDFDLSAGLLSKAFAKYARFGGVEGDTMLFEHFFVQYGMESESATLETNLKFFFDVLGDGATVSCSCLTSAGLSEFIAARLKNASSRSNWLELRDVMHTSLEDIRWAISRLLPTSMTDALVLERKPVKRSPIERKLLGEEPALPLPRLTLQQLRFVVYAVTPLSDAMHDLWFPRS